MKMKTSQNLTKLMGAKKVKIDFKKVLAAQTCISEDFTSISQTPNFKYKN